MKGLKLYKAIEEMDKKLSTDVCNFLEESEDIDIVSLDEAIEEYILNDGMPHFKDDSDNYMKEANLKQAINDYILDHDIEGGN